MTLLIHLHLYRCLAHIINLATQALISTHSKSKYYNPHDPTAHELPVTTIYTPPAVNNANGEEPVPQILRDELGLVRAIVVKVSLKSYLQTSSDPCVNPNLTRNVLHHSARNFSWRYSPRPGSQIRRWVRRTDLCSFFSI